ncbi:MAG: bifunctional diaminohydroxyphosphoribosylaminopyrimidine deaminase/5-amino-6-(5-phosphoribosylamino)uracil reductase RibD [Phycisphaerales bacterium]
MSTRHDRTLLDLAARAALRARGDVEPNPLVGALIVREGAPSSAPTDRKPRLHVIGIGHHRRYGGPHAEVEAINNCLARGDSPRGCTMYVTLEPCNHTGKTPPCTKAIIDAGIARVVIARRDPNPIAEGGAAALQRAGVEVRWSSASKMALWISEPFIKRMLTGLPWVIAKWAQTIDGRIATRENDSKWISGEVSRRRVHRLRACVDAVMTAEGTVLADNPLLTARDVARVRRVARRVVISRDLDVLMNARLITTAAQFPTTFFCQNAAFREKTLYREHLSKQGVEIVPLPLLPNSNRLDLRAALKHLAEKHGASTVLVESGPRLLGSLFDQDLIDEAHVYIAPKLLGDAEALPAVTGFLARSMNDALPLRLLHAKRSGDDMLHVYSRAATAMTPGSPITPAR